MKKCFVITPIGSENDIETRKMIEGIESIIKPILMGNGFDEIFNSSGDNRPGMITKQIFENIYYADLVVANLTGLNPNVMYELAVRHAAGKPCIQICEMGLSLPFDLKDYRTIFYENSIIGGEKLKKQFTDFLSEIFMDDRIGRDDRENPILYSLSGIAPMRNETFSSQLNEDAMNKWYEKKITKDIFPVGENGMEVVGEWVVDDTNNNGTICDRKNKDDPLVISVEPNKTYSIQSDFVITYKKMLYIEYLLSSDDAMARIIIDNNISMATLDKRKNKMTLNTTYVPDGHICIQVITKNDRAILEIKKIWTKDDE